MSKIYFLFLFFLSATVLAYSSDLMEPTIIGYDSGRNPILEYSLGEVKATTAILVAASLHGDEHETTVVAKNLLQYIRENLDFPQLAFKVIPILSPTLYSIEEVYQRNGKLISGRRGYLEQHLDKEGFVRENSRQKLKDFSKDRFYAVMYGSEELFHSEIKKYVDPNRDFLSERLPQTRVFKEYIKKLSQDYDTVYAFFLHSYVAGGRIYPEYKRSQNKDGYEINQTAWDMAKTFAQGSGYVPEMMYLPAVKILSRFEEELICFTMTLENVHAVDVELDSQITTNSRSVIRGFQKFLNKLQRP